MGKLCHVLHYMCMFTGLTSTKAAICNAKDLEEQKRVWNSLWLVQFLKSGSGFIVDLFIWLASLIFLNKLVLWYGGGVPAKQFELIQNDKVRFLVLSLQVALQVGKTCGCEYLEVGCSMV